MPDAAKIRLASTILLLRQREEMEVFMIQRHYQIEFASGALVFPGGSVDAADYDLAGQRDFFVSEETDADALALRIAAVRETFEETGILLARPAGSARLVTAAAASEIETQHRAALCEGAISFAEVLTKAKLVLALDLLVPREHWITPSFMSKRFDTHFFVALAPDDQIGAHDGKESVDSVWIAPHRALEDARSGRYEIVFPTRRILTKLGMAKRAADAIEVARNSAVVTVLPELCEVNGKKSLRIPAAAGYGGDVFPLDD